METFGRFKILANEIYDYMYAYMQAAMLFTSLKILNFIATQTT
jgi:hypothetical protein